MHSLSSKDFIELSVVVDLLIFTFPLQVLNKKRIKKGKIQVGRFLNTLANSALSCCSYLHCFLSNIGLEIHDRIFS